MKKILLFQVENPIKIKMALATMHIKVESIVNSDFSQLVGDLVEGTKNDATPCYEGELLNGSLLLMCGLLDHEVDQVLTRLRSSKINITYKAMLTPTNQKWDVLKLYEEMQKEREAIMNAREKKQ